MKLKVPLNTTLLGDGWREFLDSLDTPGGHIFISFVLLGVGGAYLAAGETMKFETLAQHGDFITGGVIGLLFGKLSGAKSNKQRVAEAEEQVPGSRSQVSGEG